MQPEEFVASIKITFYYTAVVIRRQFYLGRQLCISENGAKLILLCSVFFFFSCILDDEIYRTNESDSTTKEAKRERDIYKMYIAALTLE